MNVTQSQVSALYVTLFGRVGEGSGNKYWQYTASSQNLTLANIANSMLNSEPAKEFFGSNLDTDEKFIAHIYKTTLNKDADSDAEGKKYWLDALKSGTDRGTMVTELLKAALDPKYANSTDAATKAAHNLLVNKIMASNAVADAIQNLPTGNQATALKAFQEINEAITATSTIEQIKAAIESKKSSLGLDSTELENSLSSTSNIRVISKIIGKTEKQVEEALKPKEPETSEVNVAKFLEDSAKPENANNKFIIKDKTEAINDKIADIVTKADKVTSLTSSENTEAIKLTKEQFTKLTADKLSKDNTIEVSELEKTDKELALNDKIDNFKLKDGDLLEVNVEEFNKLKDKAGENSFVLKDTAENIAAKLADITSDANKTKIKSIDVSDSDSKTLEITKAQYQAVGDKFAADDKLKVTGLSEDDINIVKSDKVVEFKMQEGKSLNVTIAELEALKGKAKDEAFGVIDGAQKFTSSNVGALEANISKIKIIKTNDATKQEITVPKGYTATINKFAPDEKLKVTGVENAQEAKTFASKSQVSSFTLKSDVASLDIKAEDFKAIASKISEDNKLNIKDTAAAIKSKLTDITTSNLAKIKEIDASGNQAVELTKAQYNSLKDKFATNDTFEVTGLDTGDLTIAQNAKVSAFTMAENKTLNVTVAQLDATLKAKAGDNTFKLADTAANIAGALNSIDNKVKAIDVSDATAVELTKAQYDAVGAKFADDDSLKVTGLGADDVAIAQDAKVKQFTMDSNQLLKVTVAQLNTLKDKAGNDTFKLEDAATTIQPKIDDIVNDVAKIKEIDVSDATAVELTKDQYGTVGAKFAADDNLKVTDVTGAVAASNANDTFVLKSNVSGLNITSFSTNDKVSFKDLGVAQGNLDLNATSDATIDTGKLYLVNMGADIATKDYANTDFAELFAASGAALKETASSASVESIVLVKGTDADHITKIYKVSSTDGTISQGEVTLVGTVTGDTLDGANDILFN